MAEKLTIKLLGGVYVTLGGKPITGLPSQKAEALLIYLACRRRPFSREYLAALLWDDRSQEQALANLRVLLSGLRRHLKPFLIITRQTIAFNLESDYWLDTFAFSQLLEPVDQKPSPQETRHPPPSLHQAITLYRGNFLEGFYIRDSRGFEEWISMERERLLQMAIMALRRLSRHYLEAGAYEEGIPFARRLLRFDPYSEVAHQTVMLMLARNGQRNAALAQYRACRQMLANEFGVAPSPETTHLFERIRSAEKASEHTLPPQTTMFVGREMELAQVQRCLAAPECRLLTILGPGGVGKTRLALEAARRIATRQPGMFLNGIRFIPLAALTSSLLLDTAVLDALNYSVLGQVSPHEQLLNFLREKEMLLALDNFERLLAPAQNGTAWLEDLLKNAPLVKILVTSRERLNLIEEWVFDLAGLDYPGEGETAVEPGSAGQLFAQNATRLQRQFDPTPDDRRAIARICRLLDGMPLGIELASAWVRAMPCAEIAQAIETDLDFLVTDLRNVPERHRSLRAVFQHSWDLLSEEEQTAVRALSVFPSSFTEEAARAVTGAHPPLAPLVDKTFLQHSRASRFEMHNLLKQYAAEQLAAVPEAQTAVRTRFSQFYTGFLARQTDALERQNPETLAAVDAEFDNIRAAWQFAVSLGQYDHISQGLDGLARFYYNQNWLEEGQMVFEETAAILAESSAGELLQARAKAAWADFEIWRSNYDKTHRLLADCLPVLRRHGNSRSLGWAYNLKGALNYYQGDYELAHEAFQAGLETFRDAGNLSGMAFALNGMANVSCDETGDYEAAKQLYRESLSLYRQVDNPFGIAKGVINLAAVAHVLEDFEQAKRAYREGIPLCRQISFDHALAIALGNLAQILMAESALAEASELLQESLALKRKAGDQRALAFALNLMGELFTRMGDPQQAQENLEEALAIARALASPVLIGEVLLTAARLYAACDQAEDALTLLACIRHHVTQDQEILQAAARLWQEMAHSLPPETIDGRREKGEQMALTAVSITLSPHRLKAARIPADSA